MSLSTAIESIIWGGKQNIPPVIRRKLDNYNEDWEPLEPPMFRAEEEECDEPETDHYEETVATIEANNSSLTS